MNRFFSKSYKELFIASFVLAAIFAALELIGLYFPKGANIYDLYRCMLLSIMCAFGACFLLVFVILSYPRLRKQNKKAGFDALFATDVLLNALVLSNAVIFMIKAVQRITDAV